MAVNDRNFDRDLGEENGACWAIPGVLPGRIPRSEGTICRAASRSGITHLLMHRLSRRADAWPKARGAIVLRKDRATVSALAEILIAFPENCEESARKHEIRMHLRRAQFILPGTDHHFTDGFIGSEFKLVSY